MDALNAGNQAVAKAQAALIDGIQAHAQAEKTAVDARLKSKLDDLEAEAQRIGKAKNDADKLAQRAKINSAKAAEQEAAEIEKRLIDQKAATAALEQFLGYSQRDPQRLCPDRREQCGDGRHGGPAQQDRARSAPRRAAE
jgi:HPt (histidine-containing phosphotransfer) domain-containing protein